MKKAVRLFTLTGLLALTTCVQGCSDTQSAATEPPPKPAEVQEEPAPDPYADFPLYGRVTGVAVTVRKKPAPDAIPMGWLRRGEVVRLKPGTEGASPCKSGWHEIHPRGYVCAGEGIAVSEAAPQIAEHERAEANRNAPLPYLYYLVREAKVPEYHQLPSRDQQRAVSDYVDQWLRLEREKDEKKLSKFLEGTLPDQVKRHAIVRRFLERGFYVAASGVEERAQRRFVRTVRGSYVKEQQLEPKTGHSFRGVELKDGRKLPVVWAVRTGVPLTATTNEEGVVQLVETPGAAPIERLSLVEQWKGWARVGGKLMHELKDGTYLRDWYLAVAEPTARPKEVGPKEPWVHVDVGEQTLVLYVGDEPIYATLVSTGLATHETPRGSFRIHKKYVSNSMSDIGADAASDRYSIDDVPWTQYFQGSLALHAAFWHGHFGLKRSHGCINLSPADAFYVFQHTWPEMPQGWHGISTQQTGFTGTLVVITD